MQIKRKCKICGQDFTAIKTTQFFCCRRCFKKDFYQRTKNRIQDGRQNPVFPSKECGFCLKVSKLEFDPIKHPDLYDNWKCPHCMATNKIIWENQDNPNSYQIISQIVVSIQYVERTVIQQKPIPVYRVYQLPINRLEHGNPSIIVMPCEKVDFFDIQRKNRKRILFS